MDHQLLEMMKLLFKEKLLKISYYTFKKFGLRYVVWHVIKLGKLATKSHFHFSFVFNNTRCTYA